VLRGVRGRSQIFCFFEEKMRGFENTRICFECGRMITGPYGYLVTKAIHYKNIYRDYIGVDACMADLMRPGIYGAYHHVSVLGKENLPKNKIYDVVGSLCENSDKFAIQRELPEIEMGDLIIIHDTGAHGHSMGYNYNGRLRHQEIRLVLSVAEVTEDTTLCILHQRSTLTHGAEACLGERLHDRREYRRGSEGSTSLLLELIKE